MAPCCGTVLLCTPSPASYAHWTSSPSPWRPPWLKGLTCDPEKGWIRITISYLSFLLSGEKEERNMTLRKTDCLSEITGNVSFRHFPLFASGNRLTPTSPPQKNFFLLILWNFCLPKVKYRVLKSDIYSRYLRVPASGISSYPATAVLLAIEFKLNTRMTKIFLCPCIAIFNINTQALSYQHFSRQMSSINGVFKKYLFSSSQFACYLLHFEKHYRIQQLKHWNQIGVLFVSIKIIFQEAFIPSLLWKFTLIRSLTEPWKFVINCNEFVAYFFSVQKASSPVFTCSSSSYRTCE